MINSPLLLPSQERPSFRSRTLHCLASQRRKHSNLGEHIMITIINERNGFKTTFKSYEKLYNHIINNQYTAVNEKFKYPFDEWVFTCHSYRRIMAIYDFVQRQRRKDAEGMKKERLNVLEISQERSQMPVLLPITPDLSIESHMEEWCRRYCQSKGYKLIEVYEEGGFLRVKKDQPDEAETNLIGGGMEGDQINSSV